RSCGGRGRRSVRPRPPVDSLRPGAGVAGQDLSEVVGAVDGCEPRSRVVEEQQRAELGRRAAAERVGGSGNVRPTELPEAADRTVTSGAEERVELRTRGRVRASGAGGAIADAAEVGRLDPGQVRLEPDPVEVLTAVEGGTREQDRGRMPSGVLLGVVQGARPGLLVRDSVEV